MSKEMQASQRRQEAIRTRRNKTTQRKRRKKKKITMRNENKDITLFANKPKTRAEDGTDKTLKHFFKEAPRRKNSYRRRKKEEAMRKEKQTE